MKAEIHIWPDTIRPKLNESEFDGPEESAATRKIA
jgi:hypothetical protein